MRRGFGDFVDILAILKLLLHLVWTVFVDFNLDTDLLLSYMSN